MKLKVQKITWNGPVCTIDYQKIGEKVVFDKTEFMPEIRAHAEDHGFEQRFGDLESGDKVGMAKFQAAKALKEQYQTSKEWSRQAERDTLSELIEAVHAVMPQYSIEQLKEAAAADSDQIADWRVDEEVRLELAKRTVKKAEARVAAEKTKKPLVIKGLK